MVLATFRIFPARERRKEVLGILRAIEGPTKVKPHCVSCQLYQEDSNEETVLYMEQWDSDEDFHEHVRSDIYHQVLEAVELSRRAPEIHFHEVRQTRGIDLVEELRTSSGTPPNSNRP